MNVWELLEQAAFFRFSTIFGRDGSSLTGLLGLQRRSRSISSVWAVAV